MSAAWALVTDAPEPLPLAKCALRPLPLSFAAQCVADAEARRAKATEVALTTLSRPSPGKHPT